MSLNLAYVRRKSSILDAPPPLLVLLHGLGSNEQDLISLAPYLDKRFLIVSLRAPIVLQAGAYSWFNIEFTPKGNFIDMDQAENSRLALLSFLDQLGNQEVYDPKQVYLMGFSQGAIMSLSVALSTPEICTGVIAMSGRLLDSIADKLAEAEALKKLHFLVVHGRGDQVLPIECGRGIKTYLSTLPVSLTYREYNMGHEVNAESLSDIAHWLKQRLD
ncbi:MAG: phospholipase [Anaerolineae bacterium]|nr:phospholipase [Gloeobacterales cyanobacterium ES-bin-313]